MAIAWKFEGRGAISPAELQELAKTEINEDPRRTESDVLAIQEWMKKEPHLKAVPLDDKRVQGIILEFLRGCKFSLEKTKKKLDNYFTMRGALPEFFANTDPKQARMQEMLKLGVYLPLPNVYDSKGRMILVMRFGFYDPSKFSPEEMTKISYMVFEAAFEGNVQGQTLGFIAVADMSGATVAHMTSYSPTVVKKSMTFFQEAVPSRPKAFHYVHVPGGFEVMFSMVKTFMNEKLRSRLHVHGHNLDALYDHVPKECLPPELGGTLPYTYGDIADYWYKKVLARRDLIVTKEKWVSNEKLRRGKPRTSDEMFGIEGSFRKLEID